MRGRVCLGIVLLSAWAPEPADATVSEQYLAYSGIAAAQPSGEFIYGERHVLLYREGRLAQRVVLYTCADGTPFARKTATYEDPLAPSYLFEDISNGVREGVQPGEFRKVFFRGVDGKPEKSAPLPAAPGLVIDSGFDEFIRRNWNALIASGSKPLQFLVPSRLESLSFQLQHLHGGNEHGIPTEVFRLKLQGIVGWIAPSIDVSYSEHDHVLVRYQGLSDLRDKSGENLRADIAFRLSDRLPSSADAAAAATRAKLVACR